MGGVLPPIPPRQRFWFSLRSQVQEVLQFYLNLHVFLIVSSISPLLCLSPSFLEVWCPAQIVFTFLSLFLPNLPSQSLSPRRKFFRTGRVAPRDYVSTGYLLRV